jgi:hypothetical protein
MERNIPLIISSPLYMARSFEVATYVSCLEYNLSLNASWKKTLPSESLNYSETENVYRAILDEQIIDKYSLYYDCHVNTSWFEVANHVSCLEHKISLDASQKKPCYLKARAIQKQKTSTRQCRMNKLVINTHCNMIVVVKSALV